MAAYPKKWKLDVNDRYRAAAAIVITLSSASFILPIFFVKDMVGIGPEHTVYKALDWLTFTGWGLLALSVVSGILYHFFSAKWVKLAWGKPIDIFWITTFRSRPIDDSRVERLLDSSYFLMMAGFLFGLFFEILFMIMFHFPSKPDGTPIAKGERMQFIKLPSLPDFAPASAALPAGVEEIVCTVRRMIVDPATAVAIVIGRHDQTELTPSAKRFLNSNAALAQQRAKAVESTFRDFRHCDTSPILNVIALDSTPRHVGPNVSPVQLADDRRAEIYLFRRVP